jgi:V8-like Glu-specific endopeptidase
MTTASLQRFTQSIREQIAQGEIQLALDRLNNYLSASAPDLQDDVTLLTSRHNRLQRNERKGVITYEMAQVGQTKIADAILDILEDMPGKIGAEMTPSPAPLEELGEVPLPGEVGLEKILGINNLKQISWIEWGIHKAKSVCRVLGPDGLGTGFLIAQGLLITNNHVIRSPDVAAKTVVEFNYQQDFEGNLLPTCRYRLDAGRLHTSQTLDYTIVGVMPDPCKPPLENWGCLSLNPNADPVPGEHVTIIQHPNGGLKQIVLTANQVIGLWEHRLHYSTDTMPGSSGSPVFNDLWQVIAIHHAGGNLQTNAKGDRRFINEGILMSAIKSDADSFWPQ